MIAPVLTTPIYRRLNTQSRNEVAAVVDLLNHTSDCQSTFAELSSYTTHHYWMGFVAIDQRTNDIIGVLFYSAYPHGRKVEIVAVDQRHRRKRIATDLLGSFIDVVGSHDWIREITSLVPERNLPMQKTLRRCGFRCVETWEPIKGSDEDRYFFVLKKQEDGECCKVVAARELVEVA